MQVVTGVEGEAPARALALILSADGSLSPRAMRVLDALGAFEQLGVSRQRVVELAGECTSRIDPGLCERSWLSDEDIALTDAVIEAVSRSDQRALVCRLAAAAIEDDGLVTHGARLLFDHVLARWQIAEPSLSQGDRQGLAG